jgi:hypothetical protein
VRLYLDESGHTGSHLFDPTQPLFIYAGVWLNSEIEARLDDTVGRLRAENRRAPVELKGSRLLGSAPGRRFLAQCLELCEKESVPVLTVFFNKPFQAAAVVVEDCTDYVYNSQFDENWTWDTKLKEPLAKKIYQCADPRHLMDVWQARTGPKESFVQKYERLLFALKLSPDMALSSYAERMSKTEFGDIWEHYQSAAAMSWSYSPNLNTFIAAIQGADRQAEARSIPAVAVIHDEQVEYQPALANAFRLFAQASEGQFTLPNGNGWRLPLRHLRSLDFLSSSSTIGLQLADFVASVARAVATGVTLEKTRFSEALSWILKSGDGIFPSFVGPEDWRERLFRRLLQSAV